MMILALALAMAAQSDTPDYRNEANWLCRPGRQDACTMDLSTTVVAADGKRSAEPFKAANNPKFDCFYVYPTISLDTTPNSDMIPGDEEKRVAQFQAARFAKNCRVFAPVYRQVTLTALRSVIGGGTPAIDREMAFNDVKAAWDDYLAHDNKGRGVVLIGHSQGSLILTRLVATAIDGKPAQKQLVSAMLIGSSVPVPIGKDVGGVFPTVPLCRSADQAGCVVTYASFRADSPPPANTRFAKGDRPGVEAGCTNPAALGGGKAAMHAYLNAGGNMLVPGPADAWSKDGAPVTTPFVSVPGLISAQCVNQGGFNYLAVTVNADPADPRTDTIAGDVKVGNTILKDWGLHLIDMNLAQGDLVDLTARQYAAWARKH
jgi:pimeloyl-ACP methyl ester carboxylesterase